MRTLKDIKEGLIEGLAHARDKSEEITSLEFTLLDLIDYLSSPTNKNGE